MVKLIITAEAGVGARVGAQKIAREEVGVLLLLMGAPGRLLVSSSLSSGRSL